MGEDAYSTINFLTSEIPPAVIRTEYIPLGKVCTSSWVAVDFG
jgi:hypothetical protein